MLVQAISSTTPTVHMTTQSTVLTFPMTNCFSERKFGVILQTLYSADWCRGRWTMNPSRRK